MDCVLFLPKGSPDKNEAKNNDLGGERLVMSLQDHIFWMKNLA